jgi:hypothetical protein
MKSEGAILIEVNGVSYLAFPITTGEPAEQGWAPCPLCGGEVRRGEQRVRIVEENRETVYPSVDCNCGLSLCAPTEQELYRRWHRRAR